MAKWRWAVLVLFSTNVFASTIPDPTAPLGGAKPVAKAPVLRRVAPKPQLEGIVCQQRCLAVINGEVLAEGEKIAGYQVSRIAPESVVLKRGSKVVKLDFNPVDIKQ